MKGFLLLLLLVIVALVGLGLRSSGVGGALRKKLYSSSSALLKLKGSSGRREKGLRVVGVREKVAKGDEGDKGGVFDVDTLLINASLRNGLVLFRVSRRGKVVVGEFCFERGNPSWYRLKVVGPVASG
jgi:hypothetical protein